MSVQRHVDAFLDPGLAPAEHEEAVAALSSVDAVVEALAAPLTDKNPLARARGVLLLARVLERRPPLAPAQAEFLAVFFRDRSRDAPCVPEVLRGLTALLEGWGEAVSDDGLEALLVTLFAEVFVQSLDQAARLALYRLMERALDRKGGVVPVRMRHDFCYGWLQMIDGERDPRNLLCIFGLTRRILTTVPGWERFTEELFDVTACYYPISFTPKPGSLITADDLRDALDGALTASPAFAPHLYALLEREPGPSATKTAARAVRAWGGSLFGPYAASVWKNATVEAGAQDLAVALAGESVGNEPLEQWMKPVVEHPSVPLLVALVASSRAVAAALAVDGLLKRKFDDTELATLVEAASSHADKQWEGEQHPFWVERETLVSQANASASSRLKRAVLIQAALAGAEEQESMLRRAQESSNSEEAALAVAALSAAAQQRIELGHRGLAGLCDGVTIAPDAVEKVLRAVESSGANGAVDGWNFAAVAALACHGHLDSHLERLALPGASVSSGSGSAAAWAVHGLLRGGKNADVLLNSLNGPELAIALGDPATSGPRILRPGPEQSFARQRALCCLLPLLEKAERLPELGYVCSAVPPILLAGQLTPLIPLLLAAVAAATSDPAPAAGALRALAAVVREEEGAESMSAHTDTLLPRAARMCAEGMDESLRRAALEFLLAVAEGMPFTRIYPWREAILAGVRQALDDHRRDVRRMAVQVSNKYHSLE